MKKFLGSNKLNVAVFISGTGSNLKNLISYSLKKKSLIKINFVISDNPKAKGLFFAKKHKINNKIYRLKNKSKDENKILQLLKKIM